MAETISLTKSIGGDYEIVVNGVYSYTKQFPDFKYTVDSAGVKLIPRAKKDILMFKYYEPSEWTINYETGFITNKEVTDAITVLQGSLLNPPDAPSLLTATALSSSSIKLDWVNGEKIQDGISIERSADGSTGWAEISTVTSGETYTNTGLSANHYFYRIRSYKGTKFSDYGFIATNQEPLILYSSDTVMWNDWANISTITKDSNNKVSAWADKLGSGVSLLQATANQQPLWTYYDGIRFYYDVDGAMDKLKTAPFAWVQPEEIYMVFKIRQVNGTGFNMMYDGNGDPDRGLLQITTSTTPNNFRIFAGNSLDSGVPFKVGKFMVTRFLINGASSKLKVDDLENTFNAGTSNINGFNLAGGSSLIDVLEIGGRKKVDDTGDDSAILNYLKNKYKLQRNLNMDSYTISVLSDIDIPIDANEAMNTASNSYAIDCTALNNVSKYYSIYDSICTSKSVLGKTAGGLNINGYKFSAGGSKKVLLLAGVHGAEQASIWWIYKLMKYIYHDNKSDAKFTDFKTLCDVTVIPCLNADGVNKLLGVNDNGINICHNYPTRFAENLPTDNGGTTPLSEPETKLVASLIPQYDVIIDCHCNGGGTSETLLLQWIVSDNSFVKAVFDTQETPLASFLSTEFASLSGVTNIGISGGDIPGIMQNYVLTKGKLALGIEVADSNPKVGATKYTGEILDINEYSAFNFLYKLMKEYVNRIDA